MIKTHTITGGNHRHSGGVGNGGGLAYDSGGYRMGNWTGNSGELTMTYGNNEDNPETRPINYTIQIWKRTA